MRKVKAKGRGSDTLETEPPKILPGYEQYWRAWYSLQITRINYGFGASPLQYSEIESYLRINECDKSLKQDYIFFISRLDEAWLGFHDKEKKAEAKRLEIQAKGKEIERERYAKTRPNH